LIRNFKIIRFHVTQLSLAVAIFAMPFSVKVCHGAVIAFLICWLTEGNWPAKFKIVKDSILLQIVAAIFVSNLIGLFYTSNISNGWFTIEKKIFFLLLPVAIATSEFKITHQALRRLFYVFVAGCISSTIVCLWNAVHSIEAGVLNNYLSSTNFSGSNPQVSDKWLLFSYVSLADGIGIHPTFFSLYLCFSLLFVFSQLQSRLTLKLKSILWAICIYLLLFIICLSARIIILSLVAIIIVYIVRELRYSRNKSNAIVTSAILILMILVLYTNPISRYRNIYELSHTPLSVDENTNYQNSVQIRLSLWWLALKSINQTNIVGGNGTGDVKDKMQQTSGQYNVTNVLRSYDPHNQYLFTLLAQGIIGLVLLLGNFLIQGFYAWQLRSYLFLSFLFLVASLCLTESALELQKGIIFVSLVGSLMLARINAFRNCTIFTKPVALHEKP
jgi:O-antigen ligase